jgi:hypothetical protein
MSSNVSHCVVLQTGFQRLAAATSDQEIEQFSDVFTGETGIIAEALLSLMLLSRTHGPINPACGSERADIHLYIFSTRMLSSLVQISSSQSVDLSVVRLRVSFLLPFTAHLTILDVQYY